MEKQENAASFNTKHSAHCPRDILLQTAPVPSNGRPTRNMVAPRAGIWGLNGKSSMRPPHSTAGLQRNISRRAAAIGFRSAMRLRYRGRKVVSIWARWGSLAVDTRKDRTRRQDISGWPLWSFTGSRRVEMAELGAFLRSDGEWYPAGREAC